jgi:hypothetical protein
MEAVRFYETSMVVFCRTAQYLLADGTDRSHRC